MMLSTRTTTSIDGTSRCRRCDSINSAAPPAARSYARGPSSFGSFEGQRARRSLTRTFSVPPASMRAGDFSGAAPICDPLSIDPATGLCTPFAGNRIPAGRIDPLAAAFLEHVPMPSSAAALQNLTSVEQQIRDANQVSIRVDHRIGTSDQIFARFSTFDADELQPFGTSSLQETLVPGFGRNVGTSARNLGVSHSRIVASNVLFELRGGWMQVDGGQVSVNRGVDFAGQVGLQGVTRDPRDEGYPQISTAGLYSTMGDPSSFVFRDNQHFEVYNSLLLDRGAHRVKFGGYYFHLQFRPEQPDNARGAFTYTGQFTGNAFADFLLGYPTSAVSGIGRGDQDGRTNWAHLFVQDDWRVRSNLTLNLGLRYEYNQHMRDEDNRLSSVDYLTPGGRFVIASDDEGAINPRPRTLLPLIPLPYVTSEDAGWERGLLSPSKLRLAPRTGFALSLADERAVIRGGYGIFLNQWAYSVQTAFSRNLPFFFTKQVDVPADVAHTVVPDAQHPHRGSDRRCWREHHGPRLRGRVHADVERRPAVPGRSRRRWSKRCTWDRGRSARTTASSGTCPSRVRARSRRGGRSRSSD